MRKTLSLVLAVVMMLVLLPAVKLHAAVAEDAATATLMTALPEDGDRVVIHNTQYNKAMGACGTKATYYNEGKDLVPADGQLTGVTEDLIWDVTVTEEGNYRFSQDGKFLSMAASYSSMPYDEVNKDWTIETLGEGYKIKNVARGSYVEWYASKDYFSAYGTIAEGSEGMFTFRFFLVDEEEPEPFHPVTGYAIVLFTNDVHCGIEDGWGYAAVAGLKKSLEAQGNEVLLVDAGDHIQGGPVGTLTKGTAIIDIMNAAGYDLAIPGNHEFDYGMDQFLNVVIPMANYPYISANFVNLPGNTAVLDAYKIIEAAGKKIAFVGLSTPETITKSTPTYFQNEAGAYIYGFCQDDTGAGVVAAAQAAINAAKAEGATHVIVVGHMGIDEQSSPWTAPEIIAQLSGVDAFIDGHSHSVINAEVADKDGHKVLHGQTGTKLANVGKLSIAPDGSLTMELLPASEKGEDDPATREVVDAIKAQHEELLNTVVAKTTFDLTVNDPDTGKRAVRSKETNLGDLCADAYRELLGADIAFVNGGGVRANIPTGNITFGQILNVHPFGNAACLVEVTGQQIFDALEHASRNVPGENGGFLQVSGLKYEIHSYIEANTTTDSDGMWTGHKDDTAPFRVQNVQVLNKTTGEYEDLDLTKKYTLASHNYMLKSQGDGFAMFGTQNVTLLQDEVKIDNQVLIEYIQSMPQDNGLSVVDAKYANPRGEGRIKIVPEEITYPEQPDNLHPTFYGEALTSLEAGQYVDGNIVYAYPIKVKDIYDQFKVVGAQIFVQLPDELEFLEAKTVLEGALGINISDTNVLSFAWMANAGEHVKLADGDTVLTLYFALPAPVANDTEVEIPFVEVGGVATGFSYIYGYTVKEAAGVATEDGSITFAIPDTISLYGEDVESKDVSVIVDGEVLYRYDVKVKDLPEAGLMINSAQVFLEFDPELIEYRKAEGDLEWTFVEKNGKLMAVWASDQDVNLENGVLFSVYFAKKNAETDVPVAIEFTTNTLGNESAFSVLFGGEVIEIVADTEDGSITFTLLLGDANLDGKITSADAAAILRAVVGLSDLAVEGAINADVDGNGEVTAADAALILQYVVGLIDAFPAEQP